MKREANLSIPKGCPLAFPLHFGSETMLCLFDSRLVIPLSFILMISFAIKAESNTHMEFLQMGSTKYGIGAGLELNFEDNEKIITHKMKNKECQAF